MNEDVAQQLLALNHQFYQTFAVQFSATRQRIQPGVRHLLQSGCLAGRLLDIGCGNGELGRLLLETGRVQSYTGLDFSPALLAEGPQSLTGAVFVAGDLGAADWGAGLADGSFDTITAFAVLHHLPGEQRRKQILCEVHRLLAPGGRFALSNWQFLNSPRLAQRVLGWEAVNLQPSNLDPGDYLLDWRSGGSGLRYVHLFSAEELAGLADACGFKVIEQFASDGETGNLGMYQVWSDKFASFE